MPRSALILDCPFQPSSPISSDADATMNPSFRLALLILAIASSAGPVASSPSEIESSEKLVGARPAKAGTPNRTVTPVNQVLTPYALQIDLPGMRPQALALSPNGKLLVTAGKTSEIVI